MIEIGQIIPIYDIFRNVMGTEETKKNAKFPPSLYSQEVK